MTVIKNPTIEQLDPDSLCYRIYTELYNQFFNAQDKKDEDHPFGVEEGDDTSIRLHNAAYGFASAISGAVDTGSGTGDEGWLSLNYLQKAGGDMTGLIRANYGFEAGIDNYRVLETYSERNGDSSVQGIKVTGDIRIGSDNFFIGGRQLIKYDNSFERTTIQSKYLNIADATLEVAGRINVGDPETGILITPHLLLVAGNPVYHQGNANLDTVDWKMFNAHVSGDMDITGKVSLKGKFTALNGAELGNEGVLRLALSADEIRANAHLSFMTGFGIKINDKVVLGRLNENDIGISGIGNDLLLGGTDTAKIKLLSNMLDADGSYILLSSHGAAYFPDSLTVRHNFGDVILSTYRTDSTDEGVVIPKKLRFKNSSGTAISGHEQGYIVTTDFTLRDGENFHTVSKQACFIHTLSTSKHFIAGGESLSFVIDTDADFIRMDKPLEAKTHIGIDNSFTRLTDGALYFNSSNYLLSSTDGIKHYGNAYMTGDISTELYSSGFAGVGWAIVRNKTTGNTSATFDEVTVRKKMRVYEFEVKKSSVTNGSLWISDSFSGDTVEQVS